MTAGNKIRLYPTKEQEKLFIKFCNAARFAYNECLDYSITWKNATGKLPSIQEMINHVKDLKYMYSEYEWLQTVPEAVTKQAIKDLDKAYSSFYKGIGRHPKFKSKKRSKLSFYQRTDNLRMVDSRHVKITGIKEPIKVKFNLLSDSPKNPRVSFDGKFWYLSYSFEIPDVELKEDGEILGIDLGIKDLATTSSGVKYKNINDSEEVRKLEKRLKRLQRILSRKYEANKQGNKFVKTKNIIKLERKISLIHRKLQNIRDTYIHQVTYDIVSRSKIICIEDLDVSGMMKNKHLSKDIQKQEFYKFRQYLTYKCQGYGVQLVVADRYYPSSKLVHCHGYKLNNLPLSQREVKCPICNRVYDRDINAAINLRNYALVS